MSLQIEPSYQEFLNSKPSEDQKLDWFQDSIGAHIHENMPMLHEKKWNHLEPEVEAFYGALDERISLMKKEVSTYEFDLTERRIEDNLGTYCEQSLGYNIVVGHGPDNKYLLPGGQKYVSPEIPL